jgi:hypothetical protein
MKYEKGQKVYFLNPHTRKPIEGLSVGQFGFQPMSGTPIMRVKVRKGPERGALYWVPDSDVDTVLDFLARQ